MKCVPSLDPDLQTVTYFPVCCFTGKTLAECPSLHLYERGVLSMSFVVMSDSFYIIIDGHFHHEGEFLEVQIPAHDSSVLLGRTAISGASCYCSNTSATQTETFSDQIHCTSQI